MINSVNKFWWFLEDLGRFWWFLVLVVFPPAVRPAGNFWDIQDPQGPKKKYGIGEVLFYVFKSKVWV